MTPDLNWYCKHPYVEEWREHDCNSFITTVKSLNSKLNIRSDNPITIGRVSEIVGDYLSLLVRDVRNTCKREKLPRNRRTIANRFELNRTETKFILNKLS